MLAVIAPTLPLLRRPCDRNQMMRRQPIKFGRILPPAPRCVYKAAPRTALATQSDNRLSLSVDQLLIFC